MTDNIRIYVYYVCMYLGMFSCRYAYTFFITLINYDNTRDAGRGSTAWLHAYVEDL
jgi:hypothetical protein